MSNDDAVGMVLYTKSILLLLDKRLFLAHLKSMGRIGYELCILSGMDITCLNTSS